MVSFNPYEYLNRNYIELKLDGIGPNGRIFFVAFVKRCQLLKCQFCNSIAIFHLIK